MLCLTSARFNMTAQILRPSAGEPASVADPGAWVVVQNPRSGSIKRTWQSTTQGQSTPLDPTDDLLTFPLIARGIVTTGIKGIATAEAFSSLYSASDFITIVFPAYVTLTRRDRVTNIKDSKGEAVWIEEERPDQAGTVFNVGGVINIMDPFGRHIENQALLQRAEAQ